MSPGDNYSILQASVWVRVYVYVYISVYYYKDLYKYHFEQIIINDLWLHNHKQNKITK